MIEMSNLFAIVDTARDRRLYDLVYTALGPMCLFAGDLAPAIRDSAPYLVPLYDADVLLETWRREGQGKSWGIFLRSSKQPPRIRRHLRRFLLAELPDDREVLFRWWDPRVLRVYLPTCSADELTSWFEDVDEFICETDNGEMESFREKKGILSFKLRSFDELVSGSQIY
jgi:hypothetical protein